MIPPFKASQTATEVYLDVDLVMLKFPFSQSSPPSSLLDQIKVVVDGGGQIFGFVHHDFHLPLVFPPDSIVDGSYPPPPPSSDTFDGKRKGDGAIQVDLLFPSSHHDQCSVRVKVRKKRSGEEIENLEGIQPQVFPSTRSGGASVEERREGIEVVERGLEELRKIEENDKNGSNDPQRTIEEEEAPFRLPTLPRIPQGTSSRVHEYFLPKSEAEPSSTKGRWPDCSKEELKKRERWAREEEDRKWDEGIYLENFVDPDGEVSSLLSEAPPLIAISSRPAQQRRSSSSSLIDPNDTTTRRSLLLLLVEILLATSYDLITTQNDPTPESGWTIAVLCRSLVSCSPPIPNHSLPWTKTTLEASTRRMLCMPLYRNWKLVEHVALYTVTMVENGSERMLAGLEKTKERMEEMVSMMVSTSTSSLSVDQGEGFVIQTYQREILEPLLSLLRNGFWEESELKEVAEDLRLSIQVLDKDSVGAPVDQEEGRKGEGEGEGKEEEGGGEEKGKGWDLEALEAAAEEGIRLGEGGWV